MAEDHAKQLGRESINGERDGGVTAPSQLHHSPLHVPLQSLELIKGIQYTRLSLS